MIKFLIDWKWEDGLFVPLYGGDPAPSDEASFPRRELRVCGKSRRHMIRMAMIGPLMDRISSLRVACALSEATWNCPQRLEQSLIAVQVILISRPSYFFRL